MHKKESIEKGFSKISHHYEALESTSSLISWMRQRVRNQLLNYVKKDDHILEINCGSGIDAVFLAKQGFNVHATDIAPGMLAYVQEKINRLGLSKNLSTQKLSFTELATLQNIKYNHIFSNFGGLNCSPQEELIKIFNSFHDILQENGSITLVIMPKFCPWEMLGILKGNKHAWRRWRRNGVLANIEGEKVLTYYYTAGMIKKMLSQNFHQFQVTNLSFIAPTGYKVDFPEKHPKLFTFLSKFDHWSSRISWLQGIGDYYILSCTKKELT